MKTPKVQEGGSFKRKLICIFSLFLFVQGIIAARLYYWQFVNAKEFISKGIQQQSFQTSLFASRGLIQTSDGVLLAANKVTYTIYVYTPEVKNIDDLVITTAKIIHIDPNTIKDTIHNANNSQYVAIASNVSVDDASKLKAQNISGIRISDKQDKRFYPNDSLLSHVMGFMGQDSYGQVKGLYGLEQFYNGDLSGENGVVSGQEMSNGHINTNQNLNVVSSQPGRTLNLTINAGIQQMLEEKLKNGVEDTKSKMGTAIVMDPHSGAIIAMASYPTFNPNTYFNGPVIDCKLIQFINDKSCLDPSLTAQQQVQVCKRDNADNNDVENCLSLDVNAATGTQDQEAALNVYDNPAISFLYEPGSVIKVVTAAAALDSHKIDPNTIIDASATYIEANNAQIYNYNKLPLGKVTMSEILKHSSNVGASVVADMLGAKGLYDYMNAFGLGSPTQIDLAGEQSAAIPDYKTWLKINLYTASFGQYIANTPLQIASVYSTIANKGVRMKPYVVQSLNDPSGSITIKPTTVKRVISEKAATDLTQMMVEATKLEPAWGLRPIKGYMPIIASKTGSAQVPLKNAQGFDPNNIDATYAGFAPANNPKFVLVVMLQYPQTGKYAATTAVPIWETIAKQLFIDYGISPQD